jgi:glycosyltransferase involved in cell wall biosynthesis
MKSVSVVIPARNAARTMPACLEALARLEPAPTEVIIVDNGSTDESLRIVDSFVQSHPLLPIRVMREPRLGASAARNAGIRAAKGDIVAFTDADCVVTPTWLAELLNTLTDSTISAVAANIEGYRSETLLEKFQSVFTLRPGRAQEEIFCRYTLTSGGFPTANLAVRKQTLDVIRGFDESFEIYGEDHDLCRRIYAIGGRIKAIPSGTVHHIHRPTLWRFLVQNFCFGRGHAHLLRRSFLRVWRLDLPGWTTCSESVAGRVWIDLTLLDKKLLALLVLAIAYPPVALVAVVYLVRVLHQVRAHVRSAGVAADLPELSGMAGLFLLKCLAIDCGRWYGSVRHRVVCI